MRKRDIDRKPIKVFAIRCLKCKCTVYSRARHDYRSCECGEVAIDGGFDYIRMRRKDPLGYKTIKRKTINASMRELYNDWNRGTDKYGLEKGK
jgi:hypothetical protein